MASGFCARMPLRWPECFTASRTIINCLSGGTAMSTTSIEGSANNSWYVLYTLGIPCAWATCSDSSREAEVMATTL